MHVISRRKLREFWTDHPDSEDALNHWFKAVTKAEWRKFADVRAMYGPADLVEDFIVFNACGNKYRLIVDIYYEDQVVLVRHVLTHRDYDRGRWKIRPVSENKPKTKEEDA